MSQLALQSGAERTELIDEAAARLGVLPVIVEKDFWVCWLLARVFAAPTLGADVVFKGGTSLSKVFGVIQRFSEDVDLSLSPASLGWEEDALENAPSATMRQKRMKKLEADCIEAVRERFQPEIEAEIVSILGPRRERSNWLSFEIDVATRSPVLLFHYPTVTPPGSYIAPAVKLEIGSLTDQRPKGDHRVTALIETLVPGVFADTGCRVVALEVERTFWEKATILHAEHHRPAEQPARDRGARHYSDLAALWRHPARAAALARLDLLDRVAIHKSHFFTSRWACYDTAAPGSLKLCPPPGREAELARDYAKMEPMFLATPPPFGEVLRVLREAEREINGGLG